LGLAILDRPFTGGQSSFNGFHQCAFIDAQECSFSLLSVEDESYFFFIIVVEIWRTEEGQPSAIISEWQNATFHHHRFRNDLQN